MRKIFVFAVLPLLLLSCSVTENSSFSSERITVGSGPEDMLLDYSQANPRILISCAARRDTQSPFGEIVSYTPATGKIDTLIRTSFPDSLHFQPHGIFLDSLSNPPLLFAISHEDDDRFHPVYIWEIHGDTLIYRELAYSPLVHSPNALVLGENGEIYIVNDSGKRGSIMEKAVKLNRANIVRMDRESKNVWKGEIVAEKLGYPAGINRLGSTLFVGDAVNHLLHIYEIRNQELIKKEPLKGLKGNDNIRIIDGKLVLTGHVKPFKFISHTKSSENLSPVKAWQVDPENMEIETLFSTDGSLISAGSTALLLNGYLYISQVFDPFLLKVELPD